jgi:hypothetical protein
MKSFSKVHILYYMDLTEWVHVAAATVSYQCYILYYMDLTEWVCVAAATMKL